MGHALLDVVGLPGKYQQRFVLRLPAKPRDRTVIAGAVFTSAARSPDDAQLLVHLHPIADPRSTGALRVVSVGCLGHLLHSLETVLRDGRITDRLYQPQAEQRRRYALADVVLAPGRCEGRLPDLAAMRIGATRDREQGMHATVGATPVCAVRLGAAAEVSVRVHQPLEAGLDHRAIRVQKGNLRIVFGAGAVRGEGLGIDETARTAWCRKAVAARAAVKIEARAEPLAGVCAAGDRTEFLEGIQTGAEHRQLCLAQARQRTAGPRGWIRTGRMIDYGSGGRRLPIAGGNQSRHGGNQGWNR